MDDSLGIALGAATMLNGTVVLFGRTDGVDEVAGKEQGVPVEAPRLRTPNVSGATNARRNAGERAIIESTMTTSTTDCRSKPGEFAPVIDRGRCEGKEDCVRVCPFNVFEVKRITDDDFARLGVLGKLKSIAHGRKTAYTPLASACQACGKCVTACPEKAIKLARVSSV